MCSHKRSLNASMSQELIYTKQRNNDDNIYAECQRTSSYQAKSWKSFCVELNKIVAASDELLCTVAAPKKYDIRRNNRIYTVSEKTYVPFLYLE